ncbi:DUF4127 family protein [Cohnella thermotolerans]|uniref:DUF4127 family protein n=1 Tax=Cohnella thermotolerans TaxID=329858 RepID=UPI0003F94DD9|nr:DUF4127 family protein [Cohnella thermotolerans]
MARIVYVPLDERPCNAKFPLQIASATDLEVEAPPSALLGRKKTPADTEALAGWLLRATADADYLLASVDMLVYGGIVPSRLHRLPESECRRRLTTLAECKRRNPRLRIFAFNLIMRAPAYNSDDEEPDYYASYGEQIARIGWLTDKRSREDLSGDERREWDRLTASVPEAVLADFAGRRLVNAAVNRMAVDLTQEGVVDFLVIPLDDNAKYGYSSIEQRQLQLAVEEKRLLDRIYLYPGADEVGCTLLARIFCECCRYQPEVYVRHSSVSGPFAMPKYEDRSLGESLKSQIGAAGGFIGDHAASADFVLMVNSPPVGQSAMAEAPQRYGERHAAYFAETNLREFAVAIRRYADRGLTVALADVAVSNGADAPLMKLLSGSGLLPKLSAYAGWNTSGNTLGTAIAHAIVESYYRKAGVTSANPNRKRNSEAFYLSRLLEDWGYQSVIRAEVAQQLPSIGGNYFDVSGVHDRVTRLIRSKMEQFIAAYWQDLRPDRVKLARVAMPWLRMFEVDVDLILEN